MKIKAEMVKMQRIFQRINEIWLGSLKWDTILEKLIAEERGPKIRKKTQVKEFVITALLILLKIAILFWHTQSPRFNPQHCKKLMGLKKW